MLDKITKNLLDYAIFKKASEIDIDKELEHTTVRFLVGGDWEYIIDLPYNQPDITEDLKNFARFQACFNKNNKDFPKRFKLNNDNKKIIFQIETTIKNTGERMFLKLSKEDLKLLNIEKIGFLENQLEQITNKLKKPKGLILITGPQGSGLTTTLYSLIGQINKDCLNISSIENQVEYNLPEINQVQANPEIGYDISDGIYYLARQNPDIIMVNDINHPKSAQASFQYSLKGVPIFTSLNAEDIADSLITILQSGVKAADLANTLDLIIHQKLTQEKNELKRQYKVLELNKELKNLFRNPRLSRAQIERAIDI